MNTNHTYEQIANNYALWTELIDIDGNMNRETFDSTPVETLVAMMTDMFGVEDNSTVSIIEGEYGSRARIVNNVLVDPMPRGIKTNAQTIIDAVGNGKRWGNDWILIR